MATLMKPVLDIAATITVASTTLAAATAHGLKVTVVVIDDGEHMLYLERLDGVA